MNTDKRKDESVQSPGDDPLGSDDDLERVANLLDRHAQQHHAVLEEAEALRGEKSSKQVDEFLRSVRGEAAAPDRGRAGLGRVGRLLVPLTIAAAVIAMVWISMSLSDSDPDLGPVLGPGDGLKLLSPLGSVQADQFGKFDWESAALAASEHFEFSIWRGSADPDLDEPIFTAVVEDSEFDVNSDPEALAALKGVVHIQWKVVHRGRDLVQEGEAMLIR